MLRARGSSLPGAVRKEIAAGTILVLAAFLNGRPVHGDFGESSAPKRQPLEVGKPVEASLAAGEVHRYSVELASGQYVRVIAEQRGVDVVVTVLGPDGKKLAELDTANGARGPERVSLVTASPGVYLVEIRAASDRASGPYDLRLEERRETTKEDGDRIAAEKAFVDAERLLDTAAGDSLRKALQQYELAAALWRKLGDLQGEGDALFGIGDAYAYLSENQKALDHLDRSLAIMRRAQDIRGEAAALTGIGEVYSSMGEQRKALDSLTKALPLWRSTGYRAGIALTLNDTGLVYDSWGEKQKALDLDNEALPLWRSLENQSGEALTLTSIGKIEDDLGEEQRALDAYWQALSLVRASGGDPRGEAVILTNIGLVYDTLGEPTEALRNFLEALPLRKKTGDPRGEAATLTSLGKAYSDLGDKEKAQQEYSRALSLSLSVNDRKGQATALTRLGTLHEGLGNNRKALEYQLQALELRRALGDPMLVSYVLLRVGNIYRALGEGEKGLAFYREALPMTRGTELPSLEAEALFCLARAAKDQDQLDEARPLIEEAIDLTESARAKIRNPELRASYLASVGQIFDLYTDLLMDLHHRSPGEGFDSLALAATERARARSLLELLGESAGKIRQGVDLKLLGQEHSLSQLLSSKLQRRARLVASKGSPEALAEAGKEIETLTAEYDQLEARIRAESPRYAALTQPRALTAAEIREQTSDDDTLLLEYALGGERSFVWAVTRTGVQSFELPRASEIESAARSTYERIQAPPATAADLEKYWAASARLSHMVLGPIAELLGTKKRLVIVSQGALQLVPFATLAAPGKTGARAPLIATHEIVSLPSVSTLAVLRRELAGRPAAPKTLVVLADPVFDKDDARLKGKAVRGSGGPPVSVEVAASQKGGHERDLERSERDLGIDGGISRLPFTHREAEAILSLVRPEERKAALGFDASLSMATSPELSQFRFVHIATHGLLDNVRPALSGIVLSLVDRNGREQDGFLPAFEVFNLRLPADLVVLSACRTALGKDVRGEGLIGLTRAFMYAGAARVLASLWRVDDVATSELMKRFYSGMLGPARLSPASALREAQRELSRQERWSHPYYWGAFVLQGEWK